MRSPFEFEAEPFEFDPEFDPEWELGDSELEEEWYGEASHSGAPAIAAPNIHSLKSNIVRLANQEWLAWDRGRKKESDPSMRAKLRDYWATGARVTRIFGESNWWSAHPWSAAFISWIMRKAGAGNAFRYAAAHAVYIKAAKDNRLANNANPFKAYRLREVRPQIGDLVCKSRAGSGANYDNIRAGHKTHCDIVTEVHPGRLTTMGGNVGNSVSKTSVRLDANGFINHPGYFAVIKVGAPAAPASTTPYVPGTSGGGATPDIVSVRGIQVARSIAPQVSKLLEAAQADGITLGGGGYRTPAGQIALRRKHCGPTHYDIYEKPSSQCHPPTARPGSSMHERGLAIDFTYRGSSIKDHNNPGYQWLAQNAARFGLRNLPSEPWHWSTTGR